MTVSVLRPPGPSPRRAARIVRRNITLYRRSWKQNLLPNLLEPLFYLLALGFGLGLYVKQQIGGVDYIRFIAPGLAATAAMNGAVFETTYNVFIKLRFGRLYDAVITTPLEPEDCALGELLWAVIRSLIYGSVFMFVMLVLGYVRSPWALAAPAAITLIGLAFASIGLIYTALIPQIEQFSYFFTLFITPLFLFSGVFFPFENLPATARWFGWLTPLHHGVEMLRALLLTGKPRVAAGHALWLLLLSALLFPLAINLFRRRLID